MFIKEIRKQNKGYDKTFVQHRLMESYRTEKGPRQRTLLNLGTLEVPKESWKVLADRIEGIVSGEHLLFSLADSVESLAQHYATLLRQKQLSRTEAFAEEDRGEREYRTIDIGSVSTSEVRSIGAEHIGVEMFRQLELDKLFTRLGFTESQSEHALLSIVGRLVFPGSEKKTRQWAKQLSGIGELLGADFTHLSNNALYRISDTILSHKNEIEQHLRKREQSLFSLKEQIILYDLTNTYFEGNAKSNKKAKRGRSKEKRTDRPLLTLGLVLDEQGFVKRSEILAGNISEAGTLLDMVNQLQEDDEAPQCGTTVVIDAGIASEDNLRKLREKGYHYICVARNKPAEIPNDSDTLMVLSEKNGSQVEAKLIKGDGENILYCKSSAKQLKEQAMMKQFQERFENGLRDITASLTKKRGTKKYPKVLERIGRLKQRYSSIAQYYDIEVQNEGSVAEESVVVGITWKMSKTEAAKQRFSGSYFLRTSRVDMEEKEIWSLYIMLTNVEDAFRTLKQDLKMRPIFHHKEARSDAHIFITLIAYHLLHAIQTILRNKGIHLRWERIRMFLASHVRCTTAMNSKENQRIYIRNSSEPEEFHRHIYDALGFTARPLPHATWTA